MPTTNQSTRKNTSFNILPTICWPSNCWLTANVESTTMSTMARISSIMSTLSTILAKRCCRKPISSKALKIMVVDDMASMPPRKMLSIRPHPKADPVAMPTLIMHIIIVEAAIMGAAPIRMIFLNENSRPSANSRKMTPMSDHKCTLSMSVTLGIYGILGEARKPATIYPSTSG